MAIFLAVPCGFASACAVPVHPRSFFPPSLLRFLEKPRAGDGEGTTTITEMSLAGPEPLAPSATSLAAIGFGLIFAEMLNKWE